MVGELGVHRPLDQPLRQPAEQPLRARDLLRRLGAREQLIDQLVRKLRLPERVVIRAGVDRRQSPIGELVRHAGLPFRPGCRPSSCSARPPARHKSGPAYTENRTDRPPILAELGDCRRFSSSDDAVRHAGLDITVYQSDDKRAPGHLSHEAPELLRWALYEAAVSAARAGSPDHAYYLQVAKRLGHTRACVSVARKVCRRAHHTLRELGAQALAPIEQPANEEALPAAA